MRIRKLQIIVASLFAGAVIAGVSAVAAGTAVAQPELSVPLAAADDTDTKDWE
jgi:hypothetical protein